MTKINHWINGKNVASKEYFQTTNQLRVKYSLKSPLAVKTKSTKPLPPRKTRFQNGLTRQ